MQEWQLYETWQYCGRSAELITWRGHTLQVLDHGELNEQQGPDFQGCRFIFDGVTYQGAVEMHISENDWYQHQHQYNPDYRNVILHIVAVEPASDKGVWHALRSENIPAFCLPFESSVTAINCQADPSKNPADLQQQLTELALQRLQLKIHYFSSLLQLYPVEQVFYGQFLRVLGYPANKTIFEMLAARLPLYLVRSLVNRTDSLLALYLGSAGFLEQQFSEPYPKSLQRIFRQLGHDLPYRPLPAEHWQLAAIRPYNHPQFRLAAWVFLLAKHQTSNIFSGLYPMLAGRGPYKTLQQQLLTFFDIPTESYWKDHYALEKSYPQLTNRHFIGRQRIREIIINLLIPLSMSYARLRGSLGLEEYLSDFYFYLPRQGTYQSLLRRRPWLRSYLTKDSAPFLQQAFLHLEQNFCRTGSCSHCPLGRKRIEIKQEQPDVKTN